MSSPTDSQNSLIPISDVIPDNWDDARILLNERLHQIANAVNSKDGGYYLGQEIVCGQQFLQTTGTTTQPSEHNQVYRKVIDLGGLNDFTATNPQNVAHGITTNANTRITRIYGAATDPGATTMTMGIPLPHYSSGGRFLVLEMDATNIIITAIPAFNWSAYTKAYVVVEYVQQA